MSVLRYISALLLILIITLQSGFITVWALTNSDVVIHRLEELEIQAELLKGQEEYEQEISRLLVAKEEYETSNSEKIEPTFIVDPFTNSIVAVEPISPSEQIQEIINTPLLEGEEAKEIKVNREIQEKRTVKGTRGTIAINMNMGTIISSYKGDTIDPSNINISSVTPTIKSKAHLYNTQKTKKNKNGGNTKKGDADEIVNSEVFEFGIPGQHLVFSSPVAITIEAPLYSDGTPVDIAVLHAGDAEFNTSGLSTSTDTLCNSDGSTSNPGSQAIVKNGRITFYTCGASTFALGYVPARDIPNNTVWTLSPTADNKVIIGGQFTTVGGVTMGRVARVSTGGFLDTTFTNPNVNNTVYATAIQSDGKILIGGTFTTVGGIGRTYLARLNTDGSLDGTFNVAIVGSQVRAIKIQTDGKILIGGTFTTVGGVGRNRIARLNTDGSLDGTFNPNANNTVYTIAIQTDGKILVGGTFTTMGGIARTRIARVSTLGVLDVTFNPILTATAIWNIQVQTDGQIVFGGQFTIVGGVGRNNIARVSTLGVLDVTFNPNVTGGTPVVYTILIENNGNIIFGGTFTTVEGATTRNRIARYSSTGVLDTTLNPNANSTVYALGKDQSYNLLVGGAFTTMSTKTTPYFSWVGLNTDFISPNMDSISLASGTLLPIGNLVVTTTYSDTGVGIDISSVAITLEKWNGTSWGSNIAATYLVGVPIITTGTGIHSLSGIPYGKYRFRTYVSDLAGNTSFIERTFYVDAIEWDISSDIYDIGILPTNTEVFGTGTMTIIVKTVGAGFTIKMTSINTLVKGTNTINYWNGVTGWGYDSGGGTLGNPAFGITVGTESNNINLNGLKNTYTYTLKYGAKVNSEVVAGLYNGSVKMDIIATY